MSERPRPPGASGPRRCRPAPRLTRGNVSARSPGGLWFFSTSPGAYQPVRHFDLIGTLLHNTPWDKRLAYALIPHHDLARVLLLED